MSLSSSLYVGQVYHKRSRPAHHVLRYSVFSLLLDLSEIDIIAQRFWLFSRNRFNLLGFYDRDFGESANANESLSGYVHRKLRHSGIQLMPSRILLSCYPRVFGHVFNPLSLFYCLDEHDNCYAVVHEVHNTFGERHAYVLPAEPIRRNLAQSGAQDIARIPAPVTAQDKAQFTAQDTAQDTAQVAVQSAPQGDAQGNGGGEWIEQRADKALFVSPFAHMGMHYEFRLNEPGERQVIVIRASDDQGLVITGKLCGLSKVAEPVTVVQGISPYSVFGCQGSWRHPLGSV